MPVHYSNDTKITARQLADVFDRSGIRRPTGDLPRIQRMVDAGDLIVTAWDGDRLVGVARSLTDFCFCCYLSDLAVDRDYQSQGIGKTLVERTREVVGPDTALLLLAAPTAMSYYPTIGMAPIENGWIFKRTG